MDKQDKIRKDLQQIRASKAQNATSGGVSGVPSTNTSGRDIRADLEAIRASKATPVQPTEPKSNAMFPYNPNDSVLTTGFKTLGNTPQSMFNFAKSAISSINPLSTAKNIAQLNTDFKAGSQEMGTGNLIRETIKGLPQATIETLVPKGIRELVSGDTASASKTFTEDPFGSVAPVVLGGVGGVKSLSKLEGKTNTAKMSSYVDNISPETARTMPKLNTTFQDINKKMDSTISKVGGKTADVISSTVAKPFKFAGNVSNSAVAQLIGLAPDSLKKILSNPEEFSKVKQDQATRGNLASEFGKAIDDVERKLEDTGDNYKPIRENFTPIQIPKDFVKSTLGEFGLKLNKGKVIADSKSITRNTTDIKALQNFVDNWADKKVITASEFLNMRKDIAGIANFGRELGKNADAQIVGTKLYENANKTIRPQVKDLEALDAEFSPIKQQFNQIKKDFLQKGVDGEYTFKDGALNKIANSTGKGKDALLARMEEVMPGITQRVQILKAVEDIQAAYGNKVGTYARGVIGGGSLLTGNIPGIVATIVSNPSIAVPLLRGLGYTAKTVAPIVEALQVIGGEVNKGKLPMLRINDVESSSSKAKTNPVSNSLKSKLESKPTEQKPNNNGGNRVLKSHIKILPQSNNKVNSLSASNIPKLNKN